MRISRRPIHRRGVGDEDVLDQERAYGDDATQRMQTAEEKAYTLAGAERSHSGFDSIRYYRAARLANHRNARCHGISLLL